MEPHLGTEDPLCQIDPCYRGVVSLPEAHIRDIIRKLPNLLLLSDYYPLLIFQAGVEKDVSHCLRGMKRDFSALGHLVKESGAQILFSSLLSVVGDYTRKKRRMQSLNIWSQECCYMQGFWFFAFISAFIEHQAWK